MEINTYVVNELQRRKGEWRRIAEDNGFSYSWLAKYAQGRIRGPSVHRVQKLYDYLRYRT